MKDTGIGIRDSECSKLFNMFSRLPSGSQIDRNGIGLGLTICKNIVEQYGGEIGVSSVYGEGSTFSFSLRTASASSARGASIATRHKSCKM